ncbi:MAG: PAS domain-containing protein [Proteobacteria bacterium]|nr:PAS domain-containing protein [Pseudomonadota bacterium]MBU1716752.1 PAS domain-containing protein [Pseudomonadota bacterium]
MNHANGQISDQNELRLALKNCERRYDELLRAVTDYTYTVTVENGVAIKTTHSAACAGVTGFSSEEYDAQPYLWLSMICAEDRDNVLQQTSDILAGQDFSVIEHRIHHKDGSIRWVQNTIVRRYNANNQLDAYDGLVRDITARKINETEKEELIVKLQQSLKEIKTLRGILPLCSFCKKIRDYQGYWEQVDVYIKHHSDADISHSICPDCMEKHYPEEYEALLRNGKIIK